MTLRASSASLSKLLYPWPDPPIPLLHTVRGRRPVPQSPPAVPPSPRPTRPCQRQPPACVQVRSGGQTEPITDNKRVRSSQAPTTTRGSDGALGPPEGQSEPRTDNTKSSTSPSPRSHPTRPRQRPPPASNPSARKRQELTVDLPLLLITSPNTWPTVWARVAQWARDLMSELLRAGAPNTSEPSISVPE